MQLVTPDGHATVVGVGATPEIEAVYNLTVDEWSTFFVFDDELGVWSHNCGDAGGGRRVIGDSNLFQDRPGALGSRAIADDILHDPSLEIVIPQSVFDEVHAVPSQLARIKGARASITVVADPSLARSELRMGLRHAARQVLQVAGSGTTTRYCLHWRNRPGYLS